MYIFFKLLLYSHFSLWHLKPFKTWLQGNFVLLSQRNPTLWLHSSQERPFATSGHCQYFPNFMSLLRWFPEPHRHLGASPTPRSGEAFTVLLPRWALSCFQSPLVVFCSSFPLVLAFATSRLSDFYAFPISITHLKLRYRERVFSTKHCV